MYLLLKRSPNPEGAIYKLEIVMADENEGPSEYKSEGWNALGVPIKQYRGVRENTGAIPYICFKKTLNSFYDESEEKTILTDVKPLTGKSPHLRPDFGYEKLPIDLR